MSVATAEGREGFRVPLGGGMVWKVAAQRKSGPLIPVHVGPTDLVCYPVAHCYRHAAPLALRNGWNLHTLETLWIQVNSSVRSVGPKCL